jgi:glycosyltransferase involved in cell wall biosynthesis
MLRARGDSPGDIQLWVVGECAEPQVQRELEDVVHRLGLEECVRQFAAVNNPEAYYHAADVVVLSSLWEGLPNVVLEALAAGRRLVLSEAANAAGVVEHGQTGWVFRTGDAEHLADMLTVVLSMNVQERLDWEARCRQAALPFSVSRMAAGYTQIYDRLATRS